MSGGNTYEISDFDVASKWFYNWVNDSSIIKMQPEGPTSECPMCVDSGTFNIKPFDMRDGNPSSSDILGVHIPISTIYSDYYETSTVYSYWISYRAGVDGDMAEGVSVHLAWFELFGLFGAYYDSILIDAIGDTESKFDAFIRNNSCYHLSPSAYLKDRDFASSEAVQPVICVNNVDPGSEITISVSFIDPKNPPTQVVDVVEHPTIQCTPTTPPLSTSLDSSKFNLFHFASGSNGKLTVSLDSPEDTVNKSPAYIYDE